MIGIDEVGRGALAGPIIAVASYCDRVFPKNYFSYPIKDSKKLSPLQRLNLYRELILSVSYGLGVVSARKIDEIGINEANKLVMERAYYQLPQIKGANLYVDGRDLKLDLPSDIYYIVRGDSEVQVISIASIIAKVTRDCYLTKLHRLYPAYQWQQNKGYGTARHLECLRELGSSPYHRRTFNFKL